MKRVCTICARGGSKGVPGKNIRPLQGKPLIAWSVLQALKTRLFDVVAVSSDSREILEAATLAGATFAIHRPSELATDASAKVPAIRHALLECERHAGANFDTMVDIDATAPLRLPEDIVGAVTLLETTGCASVITGSRAHRSPYFNLVERDVNGTAHVSKPPPAAVVRRQDAPEAFDMNASVYVWDRGSFVDDPRVFYPDTRLYEMPAERSHDIDSQLDFEIVSFLFSRLGIADALM